MEPGVLGMLGLLLCMPVSTLAFLLDTLDPEDKEIIPDVPVQENTTWSCSEGWSPYHSDTEITCLVLVQTNKRFRAAESHCHSLDGFLVYVGNQHKEDFVKKLTQTGQRGDYWTGLYKKAGRDADFVWLRRNGTILVDLEEMPSDIRNYVSYQEQCGRMSIYGIADMDSCENEIYAICEKEVSCTPGTFGHKCERECHCLGQPCEQSFVQSSPGVICKNGCQNNWMGLACDIEKQEPEIKYYCINSAEHNGKYVYIRIYTKGLQYRAIYGMTSEQVRGEWCNSTITENESSDLTTIRIPVNNASIAQMSSGECAGQVLNESTFAWIIVLKQYEGVHHELDAEFNLTCDFSDADSLERSGEYTTGRQVSSHQQKAITKESIQDDVLLQLVNGYSGRSVSEAVLGTPVLLEMKYALLQGSLLKGIRPHTCVAYTPGGEHVKQLLDENGCQVSDSPVQPFNLKDGKIRTPWFNLFNFEDDTSVTFQCSFDLCFTSDCKVGCNQKSRQRRDTPDVTDEVAHSTTHEVAHSTTRTIRVLPSIPAKGDSQAQDYQPARPPAAPPGYDHGPFVYLNPVTCSLFLLILLVFLCMYIAFIRTLRKSVYDIRKEIEVRRSRDKFLHCGCVQQKDRDYVAP